MRHGQIVWPWQGHPSPVDAAITVTGWIVSNAAMAAAVFFAGLFTLKGIRRLIKGVALATNKLTKGTAKIINRLPIRKRAPEITNLYAFLDKVAEALNSHACFYAVSQIKTDIKKNRAIFIHEVKKYGTGQTAVSAISYYLANELTSGEHHVYRGALSISGYELMNLFNITCETSVRLGYASQKEIDDFKSELNDRIRKIG